MLRKVANLKVIAEAGVVVRARREHPRHFVSFQNRVYQMFAGDKWTAVFLAPMMFSMHGFFLTKQREYLSDIHVSVLYIFIDPRNGFELDMNA